MAKRKVVLHIGWPKTGTTTLQKHVFGRIPDHRYLGKTPFGGDRNRVFFDFVHLLAYCNDERFVEAQSIVKEGLTEIEKEQFGDLDPNIPLIISEEGILASLLKPSDHQHHGISTASPSALVKRLKSLESSWDVSFEILVTSRDPTDIVHGYYAQMFHIFRRIKGLQTYPSYLRAGMNPSALWISAFGTFVRAIFREYSLVHLAESMCMK